MNRELEINIGQIIADKRGKRLPAFIVRAIERLVHIREINDILSRYGARQGLDFTESLLEEFQVDVQWVHAERLPEDGRAIFVSNHPLGGIDGISLSHLLGKHYGSIKYLVNDMLYHLKPLQPVFLPVNTYGVQDRNSVQRLQEALTGDSPIGSFPAGYCSRYYDGHIQDRVWKPSFVRMAVEHHRDIVPLHFVGQNSRHFYMIDRLWRKLGLKFDLCTALLPDEMFRAKGKSFRIIVGEPIRWQTIADSHDSQQVWAERIRQLSYQLPKD